MVLLSRMEATARQSAARMLFARKAAGYQEITRVKDPQMVFQIQHHLSSQKCAILCTSKGWDRGPSAASPRGILILQLGVGLHA